jgi:hypothetical protein
MGIMRKGSKEAKAWGRKMKRLRSKPKTKRRKTKRKTTTRRRRTTRKGMLTLSRKRAYSRRKRKTESSWSF